MYINNNENIVVNKKSGRAPSALEMRAIEYLADEEVAAMHYVVQSDTMRNALRMQHISDMIVNGDLNALVQKYQIEIANHELQYTQRMLRKMDASHKSFQLAMAAPVKLK